MDGMRNVPEWRSDERMPKSVQQGLGWLHNHYHKELGFLPDPVSNPDPPLNLGLHAQTVYTITLIRRRCLNNECPRSIADYCDTPNFQAAAEFLIENLQNVLDHHEYDEKNETIDRDSHFPAVGVTIETSRHIWGPWAFAALHNLAELGDCRARKLRDQVVVKFYEYVHSERARSEFGVVGGLYEIAESLFCFSHIMADIE